MRPDVSAEAMALEFDIMALQKALHAGVRGTVNTHAHAKHIVPANEALTAAACDPVALRAAIGGANTDHGALVTLLVALDVINLEDYQRARIDTLRLEVEAYEAVLAERMGQAVPLVAKPETEKRETDDV